MTQNVAMLTMYTAKLAQVNVGVILTIWSINPLFMALLDYIFFNQSLRYYHIIGTISIVFCTVLISLSGFMFKERELLIDEGVILPTWVPAIFGVVTPVFFSINGVLTKHLTSEKVGFNPTKISFSSYVYVNLALLFVAVPYWLKVHFSPWLFCIGFIGSVINVIGLVCLQNALSQGPAGPVSAITATAALLNVVIEAVLNQKLLSYLEFICLFLGLFGALILVIPD